MAVTWAGPAERMTSTAGLSDRFYNEHAGHNRVPGEVPGEKWLVDGNVLDRDNTFLTDYLDDAVNKQEWIPVRQDLFDIANVERCFVIAAGFGDVLLHGVTHKKQNGISDYTRPF